MGVYITGMDMPQSGARFRVAEDIEGNKFFTSADWMGGLYYPLAEVKPPHGRLADVSKDATYAARYDHFDDHHMRVAQQMLDDLPTIIEAEGKANG